MIRNFLCFSILMALCASTYASVVLNNTRVIFPAQAKEVTVPLTNHSSKPVLVQSWLDNGDAASDPALTATPFIIIPPVTRIDGGKSQTLRLLAINTSALPRDKESVFWLNVLDVPVKPAAEDKNRLQVALRSRVKLFFRPEKLPGTPEKAAKELVWRSGDRGLTVTNSSGWYVSLVSVTAKGNTWPVDMVGPGKSRKFPVEISEGTPIQVEWVDDNGSTQYCDAMMK